MSNRHPYQNMKCRHCEAILMAYWENGVIDHFAFDNPIEGCCCETEENYSLNCPPPRYDKIFYNGLEWMDSL